MKYTKNKMLTCVFLVTAIVIISSGCEQNTPLMVEGTAGNVQIVLDFGDSNIGKGDGDFEIVFTITSQGQDMQDGEVTVRHMEVREWYVQGMLEIPIDTFLFIDAEAVIRETPHVGFCEIELSEGQTETIILNMTNR